MRRRLTRTSPSKEPDFLGFGESTSARQAFDGPHSDDGVVDGSAAGLHALFESNVDDLFGYVFVRCGRRELTNDVVGEVFAEAARVAAQSGIDKLNGGWLRHVAKMRLIDAWRREDRQRRRNERFALLRPSAADLVEEQIGDADVLQALDALPERQRAALALRYLDDASVHEVARSLGMSHSAAESLLARARRAFASAYEIEVTQ